MLSAQVLDSEATLNNFEVINSLPFIPGEELALVIRLVQPQRADKLRWVAAAGSTLTVTLPNTDGTSLVVDMASITGDLSMWSTTLTTDQTENLVGGNFTFELSTAGVITKGYVQNGLNLVITGGGCC